MNLELHLIRPLGFRVDAASLRRAGVGYWDEVNPTIHEDGEAFWRAVGDASRVFLITKHGKRKFTEAGFRRGDWVLLGNEDEGLPREWIEKFMDQTIVIPMRNPNTRCLNLATAATAIIFEGVRQIEVSAQ